MLFRSQELQGVAEGEYDHSELYNGCYVRDELDGANGEVFRMSGDPEDRRVRIEDKDGRGWYISPHRLQLVDENDPAVARWFGNSRDEEGFGRYNVTIPSNLLRKIQQIFPKDSVRDIGEWYASAEEYGQPLTVKEYANWRKQGVSEGKWFRTAYGWAGGEKPGGGKYKHPETAAAERRAKLAAKKKAEQAAKFGKSDAEQGVAEGTIPEDMFRTKAEVENPVDSVKLDIPLLIRIMEYAREDAKTDLDLHDIAERLISIGRSGNTLSMRDYDRIVGKEARPMLTNKQ